MKIVLCSHRFLPTNIGGVEIYTLRLAQALRLLGHDVHVLTGEIVTKRDLSVDQSQDVFEDIPVTRLHYDFQRRSVTQRATYSDPLVTAQIRSVLERLRPDIVHATSLSLLMMGVLEAAFGQDIPVVHTAMDRVLICRRGFHLKPDNTICRAKEDFQRCTACVGPKNRLEAGLSWLWQTVPESAGRSLLSSTENLIEKKADFVYAAESIQHRLDYLAKWRPTIARIVAPSTYTYEMFVLNGFPAEKMVISPYGVPAPDKSFKKILASNLRFGFIGRITPIKGVHILLEAFEMLPDKEKVQLKIFGDAESQSRAYMQTQRKKAAPWPTIEFLGPVDHSIISAAFRQIDILVFPSISPENSPITVLEAQAYGIPVISSDIQGVADIIQPEVNGLIFENHNATDLATQMARCLSSPELVAALANNSHVVKTIQGDAQEMIELYREVLGARKRQSP